MLTNRTFSVSTKVCCSSVLRSLGKAAIKPSIRERVISIYCRATRAFPDFVHIDADNKTYKNICITSFFIKRTNLQKNIILWYKYNSCIYLIHYNHTMAENCLGTRKHPLIQCETPLNAETIFVDNFIYNKTSRYFFPGSSHILGEFSWVIFFLNVQVEFACGRSSESGTGGLSGYFFIACLLRMPPKSQG